MNTLSNFKKSFSRKPKIKSDKTNQTNTSLRTKLMNRIGHWNFKKISKYLVVLGVFVAAVTSYFWYSQLYMTPEKKFWTALNNSMATPSVVRALSQGGSGNQVLQEYRFNFAPQRVVQNKVVYTEKSATTDTKVVTEGVIYPAKQYLRYTEFTNSRSDGSAASGIDEVIGKWASQESDNEAESKLNYLSEQVSLVIFGNYSANLRNEIIREMQENEVYGVNLGTPVEDSISGEPVLTYNISVSLKKYAELLNRAFVKAGYGEFEPLNPENYREDSRVAGSIHVSKSKNTVVGVSFGGRDEQYGNYGVTNEVTQPDAELTVEELQAGVQRLLQTDVE